MPSVAVYCLLQCLVCVVFSLRKLFSTQGHPWVFFVRVVICYFVVLKILVLFWYFFNVSGHALQDIVDIQFGFGTSHLCIAHKFVTVLSMHKQLAVSACKC